MIPPLPQHQTRAFTLVELLVVIGIIGVLLSVLLPSLRNARDSAQRVACLSNLRQLGTALMAYVSENRGSYPCSDYWYAVSGKRGDLARYGISPFPPIDQTGVRNEPGTVVERPLNAYLAQDANVSACPADLGDAKKPGVDSCFTAYGTSYQAQWNDGSTTAAYGVVPILGWTAFNPQGTRSYNPKLPPGKYGSGIRFNGNLYTGDFTRKIVLGDFNWHGNRPITDGRVLWHRPQQRNVRQQNMLFGDGHAEFYAFPRHYGAFDLPVDAAANGYW